MGEQREWITLGDAAQYYHVAKSTISRIIRKHHISTSKDIIDPRILLIDRQELLAIMNQSVKYGHRELGTVTQSRQSPDQAAEISSRDSS
ncbi:hypothetical protein [Dictyobacter formicarum]|uniref:Helix-turn-helix domain-containing protein n=1 Tax=Dictyobacter formicarum TaxID=2778368 RepID=A0ABQ3VQE4_9CHLR|nr:hypothetical protein [Dictyobacter formicarum]GHO88205.1 hypothetical protein KSZ_62110 [Dictyobacter formicarum]